ncbi:ATP-binding cassette transporter [Clonorchis sinensis]|uniref:ATP-binding cassette transporter n=1 Tax=Clonorchis sinensis TaxID=79923 RepID=G7Y9G8_CLOSI|nr:ATP-binding cassette transporter [Clonorchis sinensis]
MWTNFGAEFQRINIHGYLTVFSSSQKEALFFVLPLYRICQLVLVEICFRRTLELHPIQHELLHRAVSQDSSLTPKRNEGFPRRYLCIRPIYTVRLPVWLLSQYPSPRTTMTLITNTSLMPRRLPYGVILRVSLHVAYSRAAQPTTSQHWISDRNMALLEFRRQIPPGHKHNSNRRIIRRQVRLHVHVDREAWWTRKSEGMEESKSVRNFHKLLEGARKHVVEESTRDQNSALISNKELLDR